MFPANYPLPMKSSCQKKLSWQLFEYSDPFLELEFSSPEVVFHHRGTMYIHHEAKRIQSSFPHITEFKSCPFYSIKIVCIFLNAFQHPQHNRSKIQLSLLSKSGQNPTTDLFSPSLYKYQSYTLFLGVLWLTYQLSTIYVVFPSSLSLLHKVFAGGKLDLVWTTRSSAVSTQKHCVTLTWKTKSVSDKTQLDIKYEYIVYKLMTSNGPHNSVFIWSYWLPVSGWLKTVTSHIWWWTFWLSLALTLKTTPRERSLKFNSRT